MEFNASFIDHDVAFNESKRLAGRQATAAALARCKAKFGAFLTNDDLPARFDLIENDLRQTVASVVEEYGGDFDQIVSSVTSVLARGGYCDDCKAWKSGPRAGCTCGSDGGLEYDSDDKEDDEDSEVKEASVKFSGPYVLKYNDGTESEEDDEDAAHATFDAQQKAGLEPKMYRTTDEWGENRRLVRRPGQPRASVKKGANDLPNEGLESEFEPNMPGRINPQTFPIDQIQGVNDTGVSHGPQEFELFQQLLQEHPDWVDAAQAQVPQEQAPQVPDSQGGPTEFPPPPQGMQPQASWKGEWKLAAEPQVTKGMGASERVDLKSADPKDKVYMGDGGPEPKIDKKTWKPNALNPDGNLKPIDTDMSGTRHPTTHQDIAQVPDHTKDFKEQTKGGETFEKLKGTDSYDGSGFDKKKNITQYPTRTFGDKGQQPSGVAKEVFPKNSTHKVAMPYDPSQGESWGDPIEGVPDEGFTTSQSPSGRNIHTFNGTSSDAYDYSQSHGGIQHGDILHVPSENSAAILHKAWPISVDQNNPGSFHSFEQGKDWGQGVSPEYDEHLPAVQEARGLLQNGSGWQEPPVTASVRLADQICPDCGANPESETRCSTCKGWPSSHEGSIHDPEKNPIQELLSDDIVTQAIAAYKSA